MRRDRTWLLLAAIAAFAALGAYLLVGPRAAAPPEPDPLWRVETRTLTSAELQGQRGQGDSAARPLPGGARPDDEGTPAGPAGATLQLRVVAAEDGRPLEGALVWWLAETPRSLEEGWTCLADVLEGALKAGPDGRVTVAWGVLGESRRAVAEAAGFASSEVRLAAPPEGEVTLRLGRGLSLSGQVLDADGQPQKGLRVAARSASRPRAGRAESAEDLDRVPDPKAERRTAVSDEEGRFTFLGLSAGTFWLTLEEPGWTLQGLAPPSTLDPLPGARGVVARAGDRDARLVATRVGLVVLDLVTASTGGAINAVWTTVTLRPEGRGTPTVVTSYGTRPIALPWLFGGTDLVKPMEQPPGRVVAVVPWSAGDDFVRVEIRAAGYVPQEIRTTIQAMPAEGIGAAWSQGVPMLREHDADECGLVLDLTRDTGLIARPAKRILTLCRSADGVRVHVAGRRLDGERWTFEGLPAGEGVVEVWDGLSSTRPLDVVLIEEAPVEAKATFLPLTGALFVLRDRAGRRVYDAEALLIAPRGRERGLPDKSEATRLRSGEALVPLDPGEYRFGVSKPGLGYAGGAFVVRTGEVVRVEATLALPRAEDAVGRAGPR